MNKIYVLKKYFDRSAVASKVLQLGDTISTMPSIDSEERSLRNTTTYSPGSDEQTSRKMRPTLDFNYKAFDWDSYMRYRPEYAPELYKTVYDYHSKHSNQWTNAYDIGACVGIVAAELLSHFAHVTVSDPSSEYIETAKKFLTSAPASRVSFATHKGEDPLATPPNSIDLATIAEAIHWTDPNAVLASLQTALRPGGTVAIWVYARFVLLDCPDPTLQAAWFAVWADLRCSTLRLISSRKPYDIIASRLDCVHFDPAVWRDVRRCHWVPEYDFFDTREGALPSRIETGEAIDNRPEKDVFAFEADFAWVRGFLRSLNADSKSDEMFGSDNFRRLEALWGDGGVKRKVTFPFVLLLANKR